MCIYIYTHHVAIFPTSPPGDLRPIARPGHETADRCAVQHLFWRWSPDGEMGEILDIKLQSRL